MRYILLLCVLLAGCAGKWQFPDFGKRNAEQSYWQRYGKVYYLDGAGNLGFGQSTVPKALRAQGFRGDVENITWTSYTGPLGDQMIRINAKFRAEQLTKKIIDYRRQYPDTPVYIIGLSAGSGVGVWAVENLPPNIEVNALVLLGSSLSTNYDMTKALTHVKDKVYVFSSPNDQILKTFIPVVGTIDGAFFVQPAGIAGLFPPENISSEGLELYREKVVNIPWKPVFGRLGNAGGHTDGTSFRFLKYYILPKLLDIGNKSDNSQPIIDSTYQ
jgi:pimeloyl-ACP methyl ester carboxylesterase